MSDASPARERALIAALLRVDGSDQPTLAADAARASWEVLIAEAGRALHPMLAYACDRHAVTPPADVRAELDDARRRAALVLTRRRALVRRMLPALADAGVDAVVLKGFALAHDVFPAPDLRVMNDLDLWVAAADLAPAGAALAPLGWGVHWRHAPLERQLAEGELLLSLGEPLQLLELHAVPASLQESMPDEVAGIWARRRRVVLGDIDAVVLAPEDQLVHLCLHAAQHHHFIGALSRLLDVALVVATHGSTMDWLSLTQRVRRAGAAGWVCTTLVAARQLFGAPVSDDVVAGLGVPEAESLARLACVQAWARSGAGVHARSVLATPTLGGKLRVFSSRARLLLMGDGTGDVPADLASRLRLALTFTAPAFLRALVQRLTRAHEGAAQEQLQRENVQLAEGMILAGRQARTVD